MKKKSIWSLALPTAICSLLFIPLLSGVLSHNKANGVYAINDPIDYSQFYLCGYINGPEVGIGTDKETLPTDYQFGSDGTLTVSFEDLTYIKVKTSEHIYSFETYCGSGEKATLAYDKGWTELMSVPTSKLLKFTLTDDSGTLSLICEEVMYSVTVAANSNGIIDLNYSGKVFPNTAYTVNGNKLTIDETEITATPNSGYKFECWKVGDTTITTNGTIYADTAFKAQFSVVKVNDVLPADFSSDFDENVWSNQNGVMIIKNGNSLYIHDEKAVDYPYSKDNDSVLTQEGNNYSFTCDDGTKTTFVMESGKLKKIIVSGNTDFPEVNGEYVAPPTIESILSGDFPTTESSGWLNANDKEVHTRDGNFYVCKTPYTLDTLVRKQGNNYVFTASSDVTVTFVMDGENLTKVNVSGSTDAYNGDYVRRSLTVTKSNGEPAIYGSDYSWNKRALNIGVKDLIVSGSSEKEYICISSGVENLTIRDVSINSFNNIAITSATNFTLILKGDNVITSSATSTIQLGSGEITGEGNLVVSNTNSTGFGVMSLSSIEFSQTGTVTASGFCGIGASLTISKDIGQIISYSNMDSISAIMCSSLTLGEDIVVKGSIVDHETIEDITDDTEYKDSVFYIEDNVARSLIICNAESFRKDQGITFSELGKVFDNSPISIIEKNEWTTSNYFEKLGNGAVTVEFKVAGAEDDTYTTTAPTASGDYTVRVSVAKSLDYFAGSATKDFTIEPAKIAKVEFGDISQPVAGATAETSVTGIETEAKYAGSISWSEDLTSDGKYACGTEYTVTVTLDIIPSAAGNYEFADNVTVVSPTLSDGGWALSNKSTATKLVFTKTFETTADHIVNKVDGTVTCTTDGYLDAYLCEKCGLYYEDEACTTLIGDATAYAAWQLDDDGGKASAGHLLSKVNGVAATCTTDGYKDAWKCSRCETYYSDSTGSSEIGDADAYAAWKLAAGKINALGHDIIQHEGKAATCTETGYQAYDTCSRCDYSTYVEIPALGHSIKHIECVEPTCGVDGFKEAYFCERCEKYFEDADCSKLIGNENAYNEWKVNAGRLNKLECETPSSNTGLIVGAACGGTLFLLLLIYTSCYFFLYRKGKLDARKLRVIYKFLPRGDKNLKE